MIFISKGKQQLQTKEYSKCWLLKLEQNAFQLCKYQWLQLLSVQATGRQYVESSFTFPIAWATYIVKKKKLKTFLSLMPTYFSRVYLWRFEIHLTENIKVQRALLSNFDARARGH